LEVKTSILTVLEPSEPPQDSKDEQPH